MSSASNSPQRKMNDEEMARYLQELYDNEQRAHDDPLFRLPSEGTLPRREYKDAQPQRIYNASHRGDGKLDDALVAKYLQELYDRERRIDENIFYLPSEGTVPRSNYNSRYTKATTALSKPHSPTDELTPFLETTQEVINGVITSLADAVKDTISHVTNSPTRERAVLNASHATTATTPLRSNERVVLSSERVHTQPEENWTEMDDMNSDKKGSYDYLKEL